MTTIQVRFAETDAMGVVHHSNFFRYFEVARVEWLKNAGASYKEWVEKGIHLPVICASCDFKKPARFDDILTVKAKPKREKARVIFDYEVRLKGTEELLATGTTSHVPVNFELKIVRLPELWAKLIDAK